jgi:hypothetical protein
MDSSNILDDLNHWAAIYEKAVKDGVFETPAKEHTPSAQTAGNQSFFGPYDANPTDTVSDEDAAYWRDVSGVNSGLLQEQGYDANKAAKAAGIHSSPNPLRFNTLGPDQAGSSDAVGATYTDQDLDKLGDLKAKLHELLVKVTQFETEGKSVGTLQKQIEELTAKIDDLSNAMTQGNSISPQGD